MDEAARRWRCTRAQLADAVQQRLPQLRVVHAMRYGEPSLAATPRSACAPSGMQRVLVLPLYPQYSTTTTASVADVLAAQPTAMPTRVVDDYHLDPGWVAAVADSIRAHWQAHGRGENLLFSFHGLPQRLADGGDPVRRAVRGQRARDRAGAGPGAGEYVLSYQSRFGRERWLEPYTTATLRALAEAGARRVDVVCPGFAVDCLETLEEVAMLNAHEFRARRRRACATSPASTTRPRMPTRWPRWRSANWRRGDGAAAATRMREFVLDTPLGRMAGLRGGDARRAARAGAARLARQRRQLRAAGGAPARHRPGRARPARPWRQRAPAAGRGLFARRRRARGARRRRCAGLGALRGARPFDGRGIASLLAAACPERVTRFVAIEALGALAECRRRTAARLREAVAARRALAGKRLRVFPDIDTAVRARMQANALSEPVARLLVERGLVRGGRRLRLEQRPAPDPAAPLLRMTEAAGARPGRRHRMPDAGDLRRSGAALSARTRCGANAPALLPRGELVVLAGGHHLHMEDPAAVAAAIGDFSCRPSAVNASCLRASAR